MGGKTNTSSTNPNGHYHSMQCIQWLILQDQIQMDIIMPCNAFSGYYFKIEQIQLDIIMPCNAFSGCYWRTNPTGHYNAMQCIQWLLLQDQIQMDIIMPCNAFSVASSRSNPNGHYHAMQCIQWLLLQDQIQLDIIMPCNAFSGYYFKNKSKWTLSCHAMHSVVTTSRTNPNGHYHAMQCIQCLLLQDKIQMDIIMPCNAFSGYYFKNKSKWTLSCHAMHSVLTTSRSNPNGHYYFMQCIQWLLLEDQIQMDIIMPCNAFSGYYFKRKSKWILLFHGMPLMLAISYVWVLVDIIGDLAADIEASKFESLMQVTQFRVKSLILSCRM